MHVDMATVTNEVYGKRGALDLDNLDVTTDAEIDEQLTRARKERGALDPGPLYAMTSSSVLLYTRPDFSKLNARILDGWYRDLDIKPIIAHSSFVNLHTYINQGWETGIENCTRGLQGWGVTRAQLMEVIVHAGLSAGPRGMQRVYSALGIILGDYVEQKREIDWPEGWAPDMAAFKCGLDTSTRQLTGADKQAIETWYDKTIGEVPRWITWLARHDPTSLKAYRGRWEGTFRGALPKQMFPYLSMRHNTVMGDRDGLREAVLLARAWGITDVYIVNTIIQSAHYYTGMERLSMVDEVLGDIL
jgi:hypothetical protein